MTDHVSLFVREMEKRGWNKTPDGKVSFRRDPSNYVGEQREVTDDLHFSFPGKAIGLRAIVAKRHLMVFTDLQLYAVLAVKVQSQIENANGVVIAINELVPNLIPGDAVVRSEKSVSGKQDGCFIYTLVIQYKPVDFNGGYGKVAQKFALWRKLQKYIQPKELILRKTHANQFAYQGR